MGKWPLTVTMDSYAELLVNLQRQEPANVPLLFLPYNELDLFDDQFNRAYSSLQRNIWHKSRISSLVDAYFLGKLLGGILDRKDRMGYYQKLTDHYKRIVENTFDIFEFNPDQIQRTQLITVQYLRRMPRPIVKTIRESLLVSLTEARD